MSEYSNQLETAYRLLESKKNIPELFCQFVEAFKKIPSSALTPEIQAKISTIFQDLNKAIQKYNEQFNLLVKELGTLCNTNEQHKTKQFLNAFLDLLRLAFTVYQNDPETLYKIKPAVQNFISLLESKPMNLEENNFTNALFVQLVKSAWALTKSRETIESVHQQITRQRGGHNTRKQKRRY